MKCGARVENIMGGWKNKTVLKIPNISAWNWEEFNAMDLLQCICGSMYSENIYKFSPKLTIGVANLVVFTV